MPSIRRPLSIREKLIAMYSDPANLAIAHRVAVLRDTTPGTAAYHREVTYFLIDLECRLHTNRIKAAASLRDHELWQRRRKLIRRLAGDDILPVAAPSVEQVRKWRYRLLPTTVGWTDSETGEEMSLAERQDRLAHAYATDIPETLQQIRRAIEHQSIRLAVLVGQYPREADEENLSPLGAHNIAMSDGTWIRPFSGVEGYEIPAEEPNGGKNRVVRYAGSRARTDRTRRVSTSRPSYKPHGPTEGTLHTALMTRTGYGRIIHTIDRTFGGEVQAALQGFGRIAQLVPGRIRALAYDKAFEGWNADFLLANYGALRVAPPQAAKAAEKDPDQKAAQNLAKEILEEAFWAAHADEVARCERAGLKKPKRPEHATKATSKVKHAVAARILGEIYSDQVEQIAADAAASRATGRGLPPGASAYLSSANSLTAVKSVTKSYLTVRHTVEGGQCEHPLILDDGALWSTMSERGKPVKEQRLRCVKVKRLQRGRTGWYELRYTYQLTCEATGEILTKEIDNAPDGAWRPDSKGTGRKVAADMLLVAPCDPEWRPLYGLRNETESWFSWLKDQFLQHQRAASLDLNHQFLDVLHAAMLTNSFTRYHYLMEGDC